MARKQTPDGRRVTFCIKLSEAEAAEADARRGPATRSEWGRRQLLADPGPPPEAPARSAPPGRPAARPKNGACPHRVPAGAFCKKCAA